MKWLALFRLAGLLYKVLCSGLGKPDVITYIILKAAINDVLNFLLKIGLQLHCGLNMKITLSESDRKQGCLIFGYEKPVSVIQITFHHKESYHFL